MRLGLNIRGKTKKKISVCLCANVYSVCYLYIYVRTYFLGLSCLFNRSRHFTQFYVKVLVTVLRGNLNRTCLLEFNGFIYNYLFILYKTKNCVMI